jgi:hypothetical protein
MNTFKKIATGTLAALTLGVTLAASTAPAEAKFGRNAAFFGGLAVGALAIGAASHAYAAPRGYYVSGGHCWLERRAVYNSWGDFAGYRRIRVCN